MGRDHHQKECSCSPPVKHKPGSESLERVFCLEESSFSSPRSTDFKPERVFRERCLPRGKESSSSSFPLRHKTRLCAFLKNMNAAVLSLSDKVFLCPGLPASRKARVQSASARCLLGFDIFSSGSPTCSFVCHTLHPCLTCASCWLISDLPLVATIKLALQLCEAEQDLPAELSSLITWLTTM